MISEFTMNQLEEVIDRIVNSDGAAMEKAAYIKERLSGDINFSEFLSWFQEEDIES